MKHFAPWLSILVFLPIPAAVSQPPRRRRRKNMPSSCATTSPLRDQHVEQYDAMIRHLQSIQFEFVPPLDDLPEANREDRGKNYLTGVIQSAKARDILNARACAIGAACAARRRSNSSCRTSRTIRCWCGWSSAASSPPSPARARQPDPRPPAQLGFKEATRLRSSRLYRPAVHAHRRHHPKRQIRPAQPRSPLPPRRLAGPD